jgi:hypothetical protein
MAAQWESIADLMRTLEPSSAPPPPVAPYPDLAPLTVMRQIAAPPSASSPVQRDEESTNPGVSIGAEDLSESAPSPEALDKLVQQVYVLICQRLAIERERHGFNR